MEMTLSRESGFKQDGTDENSMLDSVEDIVKLYGSTWINIGFIGNAKTVRSTAHNGFHLELKTSAKTNRVP